ncbi:hypothetical protein HMPREF0731_1587, partial [Pseudoroseomonas cervicalis ATCC 49957]
MAGGGAAARAALLLPAGAAGGGDGAHPRPAGGPAGATLRRPG